MIWAKAIIENENTELQGGNSYEEIRGNTQMVAAIVAAPVDACIAVTHQRVLEVKHSLPKSLLYRSQK